MLQRKVRLQQEWERSTRFCNGILVKANFVNGNNGFDQHGCTLLPEFAQRQTGGWKQSVPRRLPIIRTWVALQLPSAAGDRWNQQLENAPFVDFRGVFYFNGLVVPFVCVDLGVGGGGGWSRGAAWSGGLPVARCAGSARLCVLERVVEEVAAHKIFSKFDIKI